MNKYALLIALTLIQACGASEPSLPKPQGETVRTSRDACIDSLREVGAGTGPLTFDVSRELGGLKASWPEAFEKLATVDVECRAPSPLPDEDDGQRGKSKAVRRGSSSNVHWVAYTYPAERPKANLYGYVTTLVRFDSTGKPVSAQIVSELMAYEGYVRHVRSTMKDGQIRTCIQEAELFAYGPNGDITGDLPTPRYTEEACGRPYVIGDTDGRSSFPLTSIKTCRRDDAVTDFCDERHVALMSKALRERTADFGSHHVLVAMPEGTGRQSFVAIDATNGVAYPLPFDSAETHSKGPKGKGGGYRISGYDVCFDGIIHVNRRTRSAGGCYRMIDGAFKRLESPSVAADCKQDLSDRATPSANTGVSVFRLFRTFPPQASEPSSGSPSLERLISRVHKLQISAACLNEAAGKLRAYDSDYFNDASVTQASPLLAIRTSDHYILGLLHPGFVEGDGEGSELAVSFVFYDTTGRYVDVVPRASSWRTYEGTELIQEACLSEQGITARKIAVYPESQDQSGRVIRYEKPEVQGLVFYPTTGETPPVVKFDCDSFPALAHEP
ncbi:hypothetical protein ABIE51_003731 [Lysobacter sp. OAE881]|uniref:hypothetical protein n=1 Tax=Lysobacter sp. OAE881 TaxID=2663813 RepID=UPI00178AE7F3